MDGTTLTLKHCIISDLLIARTKCDGHTYLPGKLANVVYEEEFSQEEKKNQMHFDVKSLVSATPT